MPQQGWKAILTPFRFNPANLILVDGREIMPEEIGAGAITDVEKFPIQILGSESNAEDLR